MALRSQGGQTAWTIPKVDRPDRSQRFRSEHSGMMNPYLLPLFTSHATFLFGRSRQRTYESEKWNAIIVYEEQDDVDDNLGIFIGGLIGASHISLGRRIQKDDTIAVSGGLNNAVVRFYFTALNANTYTAWSGVSGAWSVSRRRLSRAENRELRVESWMSQSR